MADHEGSRFDLLDISDAPQPPPTLKARLDAREAEAQQGPWVPACGGTEVPFSTRTGRRLLYCWQPSTGRHAYLDCATDLILSDEESRAALALW